MAATVPIARDPFDALGDPNRRAIVELLAGGDRSVQQLADALPISRPAVSRHLRLLKEAGLVVEEPRGTRRIYRLHDEGVDAVRGYLERVWGEAAARFRLVAENTPPQRTVIEPIRLAFEVDCPADHAFDVWTGRIVAWWPADHTVVGRGRTSTVVLERRPGGRIFERTAAGDRARLGRGHRLGATEPVRLPVAPPPAGLMSGW